MFDTMSIENRDTRSLILKATWRLMEQSRGQGVSMNAIAKEVGISRQALYLHFNSRVELVSATVHYVDEIKGLEKRLQQFEQAETGIAQLEACIEIWGNYIPEIYGLAKALLATRDSDEAAASAWNGCMGTLRNYCRQAIETLDKESSLAENWDVERATEMFWSMLSIHNWEQLTIECGWSVAQYIEWMKVVVKQAFIN